MKLNFNPKKHISKDSIIDKIKLFFAKKHICIDKDSGIIMKYKLCNNKIYFIEEIKLN